MIKAASQHRAANKISPPALAVDPVLVVLLEHQLHRVWAMVHRGSEIPAVIFQEVGGSGLHLVPLHEGVEKLVQLCKSIRLGRKHALLLVQARLLKQEHGRQPLWHRLVILDKAAEVVIEP